MNAPPVHLQRVELRGDACIEDTLEHILRNAVAVIEDEEGANTLLFRSGYIDLCRMSIAGIAKHLDNDVLDMLDVVLCLTSLGLGNAKAHEALAKVLFHPKGTFACHGGDERDELLLP